MPPTRRRSKHAPPSIYVYPAPPVPPATTNIPTPAYSEQIGPAVTVDGTNSNPPEPIPIPPAPASTSTGTHLPGPTPNLAPILINNTGAAGAAKKTKKAAASKLASKGAGGGVDDVSDIHLDREETDEVPVYDTCDEIRRKLTAYLRREGVTQAALLRMIHAELHGGKKTSRLQSSQLARFLQMKGANTGNTSVLFYASYVYFEKLRVKQGKPKSGHREEMERIWGKDGFDIETSSRGA